MIPRALPALAILASLAACGGGSDAPPCPIPGTVRITSQADWDRLTASTCKAIEGALVIDAPGVASFTGQPVVETLGGNLTLVGNDALIAFTLPAVRTMGRCPTVQVNPVLTSLSLPAFQSCAGSSMAILQNPALASLDLPALATVAGTFSIDWNDTLPGVSLPALTSVGGSLELNGNPALASLSLPRLASGKLAVVDSMALRTLTLPALASSASLVLTQTGLESVSLPALTTLAGPLTIVDNTALQSLAGLDALASMANGPGTSLQITGNTTLPQCQAAALLARLQLAGYTGPATVSGNDAASCP